jgi:transcriptional regulator with PAS, ATPase and Fis domain
MENKIAVISPSSIMTKKIKKIIEEEKMEIIVREATRQKAVNEVEELIIQGVKVFISRGVTATILREKFDIPVINIRHTFFDCYNAYINAKKISPQIAFLATSNDFNIILNKSKDFLIGADIITINNLDNIDNKLKEIFSRGYKVAIGGLTLKEKVLKLGIDYIMTEADTYSLIKAIEDAEHILKIEIESENQRIDIENKFEMINSIFHCATEGMISIDKNGTITNININAKNILNLNSSTKLIDDIMPTEIFSRVLKNGEEVKNEIIIYKKITLIINIEPVKVNNKIIGAVVTLKKANEIEAAEQKYRRTILNKGHVAIKTFDDIIGRSESMKATKNLAKKYSKVDSTVLILGETGTGKEIFAESIHNYSTRKNAPFVAINCAAFPASVLESELFGYVEGAFTGALKKGKMGIFELAHNGTIFLDEISEAPLDVQLKLLRVIQERKIMRIGGDELIPIDVRLIAASNKDLKKLINKGLFREDLYYRLCVLELRIPSLNERRQDIPDLVKTFINESTKPNSVITNKAIDMLMSYEWSGNVRQLNNIVERLTVIKDDGIITSDDVLNATANLRDKTKFFENENSSKNDSSYSKGNNEFKTEEDLLKEALIECNGNKKLTAQNLGISTSTLWRKIKKYKSIDDEFINRLKYNR